MEKDIISEIEDEIIKAYEDRHKNINDDEIESVELTDEQLKNLENFRKMIQEKMDDMSYPMDEEDIELFKKEELKEIQKRFNEQGQLMTSYDRKILKRLKNE